MNKLLIVPVLMLFTSCTWWQVWKTTETVVSNYPSDNIVEELAEDYIEDRFDLEEGSLDLSPFSPESA